MERADARRLQPHFIASFFLQAFRLLGGTIHEREPSRYEIRNVPAPIRARDRAIGRGEPVLIRYERIVFDKNLINPPGKPPAAFVCPGYPLLDASIDLVIERYRDLLKRGAILIDEADQGDQPRALVFLEHSIQDARLNRSGTRRMVSKRLQFVEIDGTGATRSGGAAPYLDYRPLTEAEVTALAGYEPPTWLRTELEDKVLKHAAIHLVPGHFEEVQKRKIELINKTEAAVRERLTAEINYWDARAAQLKEQELAGKVNAKLNSGLARQRADDLTARLEKRLAELEQERKLSPLPPVVLGGAMVVPMGLLRKRMPAGTAPPMTAIETAQSEQLAMKAVMEVERRLGFEPRDVSQEKLGYDIESAITGTGRLRFLEVKGRAAGANTVTVTRQEILTALNKPEDFILAVVAIDGETPNISYVRQPFTNEPDFTVTSVNFNLAKLLSNSGPPS
jgi:hypothetical protein